jgi:hypothetical protein
MQQGTRKQASVSFFCDLHFYWGMNALLSFYSLFIILHIFFMWTGRFPGTKFHSAHRSENTIEPYELPQISDPCIIKHLCLKSDIVRGCIHQCCQFWFIFPRDLVTDLMGGMRLVTDIMGGMRLDTAAQNGCIPLGQISIQHSVTCCLHAIYISPFEFSICSSTLKS